jgi:predicted AAA+ superfamily ATPase
MRYLQSPSVFREEVMALPNEQVVVVDEVQKVPALLDEIHFMIQETRRVFVLCGSSARKLKKGHANLLGGRALRYELMGLSRQEIGGAFDLEAALNAGLLPAHYGHGDVALALRGYVENYLREEILHEGLTRSLPVFSDFLRVAAIGDSEIVNLSNIARESGVSAATVRDHYGILVDTMIGAFVPAYTQRPKRRTIQAPKFYFRDLGVVSHLARRGRIVPGSELFGKAFENWIFHELSVHRSYSEKFYDVSHWRLSTGVEVDFILGSGDVAIEVKAKERVTSSDLHGLMEFANEYPGVKHRIVVSLEPHARLTDQGIKILPYQQFCDDLWRGQWI